MQKARRRAREETSCTPAGAGMREATSTSSSKDLSSVLSSPCASCVCWNTHSLCGWNTHSLCGHSLCGHSLCGWNTHSLCGHSLCGHSLCGWNTHSQCSVHRAPPACVGTHIVYDQAYLDLCKNAALKLTRTHSCAGFAG